MARCRPLQPGEYPPTPCREWSHIGIGVSLGTLLSERVLGVPCAWCRREGRHSGRAGTAGHTARSSAPAHVHPVPWSLPLLSFTAVGAGLRSPCTVGCGLQSAAPTRPFRGILGCPSKGQPTPLELAVRSTGNGGHSGTEGLPGGSWSGGVGSDCGEGTRPNAPWSAPWAAPPCPALAHRLLDEPLASCTGSPEVCVGWGLLLSASCKLHAPPRQTSSLYPQGLDPPLDPSSPRQLLLASNLSPETP